MSKFFLAIYDINASKVSAAGAIEIKGSPNRLLMIADKVESSVGTPFAFYGEWW